MENHGKVQDKLNELNNNRNGPWLAVAGFHAITGFNFGDTPNGAQFNPGFGYPVKIFVNNITGEIKVFSAYLFKD